MDWDGWGDGWGGEGGDGWGLDLLQIFGGGVDDDDFLGEEEVSPPEMGWGLILTWRELGRISLD